MSRDDEAWAREFDRLCERLLVAEHTLELLHAVDAHDLMERPARVLRCLIELSYGQGLTSVRVESRRKLAALVGFGESKMGETLDELVAGQMLQVYPDTKVYEVLPNWQKWRARPRCRFGLDGAAELSAQILAEDQRRRGEQIEFAEREQSFAPDTTLQEAAGQLAREEAGLPPEPVFSGWTEQQQGRGATGAARSLPLSTAQPADLFSPGADARENRSEPDPSAIINGAATAAGPRLRLSEAVRQSPGFAGRPKLPEKGSSDRATGETTAPKLPEKGSFSAVHIPKLPGKGSFGCNPAPDVTPKLPGKGSSGTLIHRKLPGKGSFGDLGGPETVQNFPEREVSSRARASDDHHQSSSDSSSVLPSKQRFSSDDHPDDEEPEADDRSGEERGEGMMMVPVHDEVFGDIQRKLGVEGMLSFSSFWRAAIFANRSAAIHALDQVKYADRRIPGGYMRRCFYVECAKRGVRLRHPELVTGIPRELRGLWCAHHATG